MTTKQTIFGAERLARYTDLLDAANARGDMTKAEYKDIKYGIEHALNMMLEEVTSTNFRAYYAEDICSVTIHTAPAYLKKVQAAKAKGAALNFDALYAIAAQALVLKKDLEAWKPRLLSGRRPVENPKTAPRTIENTGTCPVCGANVKRDKNGNLVDHGFKISVNGHYMGWRSGHCFGVGRPAWEVSKEGAALYILALKKQLVNVEYTLAHIDEQGSFLVKTSAWGQLTPVGKDDARFIRVREQVREQTAAEMRSLIKTIGYYEERVATWAPAPLPGN